MDFEDNFVLENCGIFYKLFITETLPIEEVVRKLLYMWGYAVVDFNLEIQYNDGTACNYRLNCGEMDDLDYYRNVVTIGSINNLIGENTEGVVTDFYVIFNLEERVWV